MISIRQNFRGIQTTILHKKDAYREKLERDLSRLGLITQSFNIDKDMVYLSKQIDEHSSDLVFFDADEDIIEFIPKHFPNLPYIAIVGVEAPSRLTKILQVNTHAILHKPIRSMGIYTALFIAINEFDRQQAEIKKMARYETRIKSRRFIMKAILKVMQEKQVDDDEAYRILRGESMQYRMPIEEYCCSILAKEQPEIQLGSGYGNP